MPDHRIGKDDPPYVEDQAADEAELDMLARINQLVTDATALALEYRIRQRKGSAARPAQQMEQVNRHLAAAQKVLAERHGQT